MGHGPLVWNTKGFMCNRAFDIFISFCSFARYADNVITEGTQDQNDIFTLF